MLCLFGCCFPFKTSESEHKWVWGRDEVKRSNTENALWLSSLQQVVLAYISGLCFSSALMIANVYREDILALRVEAVESRGY